MKGEIIRAWEAPRTKDTETYIVGNEKPGRGWRVGMIIMSTMLTESGIHGEFVRFKRSRVDIFDDADRLMVSLPTDACAVEYAYFEREEEDG